MVDLDRFFDEICRSFESAAQHRGIRFTQQRDDELGLWWLDEDKLEKICGNLLSNAFKFTPKDGAVKLRVHRAEAQIIIEVLDTGPGIPAEHHHEVFERFAQLSHRGTVGAGTGIGLWLTKELVTLQGGTIAVDTAPEGGAWFIVRMPLQTVPKDDVYEVSSVSSVISDERLDEAAKLRVTERVSASAPLVLIVDDDPDLRQHLTQLCSSRYRVRTASDGVEALEQIEKAAPDIVVSDVMMPRMDGGMLAERLKSSQATRNIPIILLSAVTEPHLRVEHLSRGADDFVSKPFHRDELLVRIHNMLLARSQARELAELNNALQERNRELDEFSAVASHDLKAPLRRILTFAEMLESGEKENLSEEGKDSLQRIRKSANRMQLLVKTLLDYARLGRQSMSLEPVDLKVVIQECLADSETLLVDSGTMVQVKGEYPQVLGDQALLRQVFQNLIQNSVRYAKPNIPALIQIRGARSPTGWTVEVEDNGIGIEEFDQAKVFEMFVQSKSSSKGIGAGLAICKRVLERHEAKISVRSELGKGTVFQLEFPAKHLRGSGL